MAEVRHDGQILHDGTYYHSGDTDFRLREYEHEFDVAEMRYRNSSIRRRPDAISPDYLTSFTFGPNAQGDASGGVLDRLWRVRLEGNSFRVSRSNGPIR